MSRLRASNQFSTNPGAGTAPIYPAAIDREAFAALRRQFEGEAALFDDLLNLFARELGPRVEAIAAAARRADPGALAQAAHVLKGSSLLLGATRMAQLCHELEVAGRRGAVGPAPVLLAELEHEMLRVRDGLETARESGEPAGQ